MERLSATCTVPPPPFDLKLALVEASQGKIGPTISQITRFCFRYDPEGKKLVFNTLKVTGIVTLLFALSFVAFLFLRAENGIPEGSWRNDINRSD